MGNNVVNKRDIARIAFAKLQKMLEGKHLESCFTQEQMDHAVDLFFDEMAAALTCGDRVELRGFGSMVVRPRPEKVVRNPKTNERVLMKKSGWLYFRSSKELVKNIMVGRMGNLKSPDNDV